MSMGKEDSDNIIKAVTYIAKVRKDQINSRLVIFWEENSAINNQQLSISLKDGHIATDFRDSTERDDSQAASYKLRRCT
jgi:hypothetical protein